MEILTMQTRKTINTEKQKESSNKSWDISRGRYNFTEFNYSKLESSS